MFLQQNFLRTGILVLKTMENGDCTSFGKVLARPQVESAWKQTQSQGSNIST
jgi:hypothetical protein